VARRWRIRYKLLFGFGLIVAIMALLLLGTLRGLWSYYLTMNGIRGKHAELKLAEEFKDAVADVARLAEDPHGPAPRRARPANDAPPALLIDPAAGPLGLDGLPRRRPETLHEAIDEADRKLEDYERQAAESLGHGRDPLKEKFTQGRIDALRDEFKKLEKAAAPGDAAPDMGAVAPDHAMQVREWQRVEKHVRVIRDTTADLCNDIHDELREHISESRSHYQITLWITITASVVGLLLVSGLVRSFTGWILVPIRDLEAGVGRVARGDFSRKIELHSGDEMEDLAAAFNDMMQRLHDLYSDLARQVNERSRQLVRSERLASVGFLAAGVAHEINNPLASIAFCSEALEARLADLLRQARPGRGDDLEVFGKYLKMIQEEAFRCKNITERLLAFSRSSERHREPTDLRALVQSVLDVTQHLQNHRGKRITLEVGERPAGGQVQAWVNAEEIKSVVLNLVVNALESMDEGGHLVIRLAQQGDRAELRFTDNGCGMTPEVLENIFEPFFTRSRTGKGTGLGLTISHRIITQHGGEMEAASAGPNQGSTFTVRLPLEPPPEEPAGGDRPEARPLAEARRAA
jgi:signal transduction histidine kinase